MGDTDMKCPGNLAKRTRWIQSFQRKMERPKMQLQSISKVLLEGQGRSSTPQARRCQGQSAGAWHRPWIVRVRLGLAVSASGSNRQAGGEGVLGD